MIICNHDHSYEMLQNMMIYHDPLQDLQHPLQHDGTLPQRAHSEQHHLPWVGQMHVDLDICIHVDDACGANVVHGIDVCLCLYDDDHDILQERLVRLA